MLPRISRAPHFDEDDKCVLCRMKRPENRNDPCIEGLPGVEYACCGHGLRWGYIKFVDGRTIRFIPTEMNIDKPEWETVEDKVSVRRRGDRFRVLNFMKRETETRIEEVDVLEPIQRKQ